MNKALAITNCHKQIFRAQGSRCSSADSVKPVQERDVMKRTDVVVRDHPNVLINTWCRSLVRIDKTNICANINEEDTCTRQEAYFPLISQLIVWLTVNLDIHATIIIYELSQM